MTAMNTKLSSAVLAGLVSALLLCSPDITRAQSKDGTRSYDLTQPGSHNLRNFSVRNQSGEVIEWAELRLTDGTARTVTDKRPLANSQGEVVGAPGGACLAEVHVRFEGGRVLDSRGLNDCKEAIVSIQRDSINLGSNAR